MSSTVHPLLWSLCAVQFGLISILATKYFGTSDQKQKPSWSSKMGGAGSGDGRVKRITMFKVPDPENQKKFVDAYDTLAREQQRGGQPYILSVQASMVNAPTARGYTIVAETEFASAEDMKYYDTECPAHINLKKAARGLGVTEPPLSVYY